MENNNNIYSSNYDKIDPFKACVRIRPLTSSEKNMIANHKTPLKNMIKLENNKTVSNSF